MDEKQVPPARPQSSTPPKAISTEEAEIGATAAAAAISGKATSKPALGLPTVIWIDFMDSYRYELKPVQLKRNVDQAWGLGVSSVSTDVVQVSKVDPGSPAERANTDVGAYVMAINGKKIKKTADVQTWLDSNRRNLRIVLARKRQPPLDPSAPLALPSCWQRSADYNYEIVRLDPTDQKRVGTGVGVDRTGRVFISVVMENSAGSSAGLRVGDRLVTVNDSVIISRHHCRTVVKDVQGNPFDMVIERPKDVKMQSALPAPLLPCSQEGGEPAQGIPEVPDDICTTLDTKTKEILRAIRSISVRPPSKKDKQPSTTEYRVKLKKDVKSSKLKTTKPPEKPDKPDKPASNL